MCTMEDAAVHKEPTCNLNQASPDKTNCDQHRLWFEGPEDQASKLHLREILHTLNAFRKIGKYCDASVTVVGRQYLVHRNILAASSPLLDEKLSLLGKAEHCEVLLEHADLHDLEEELANELVDFLYTGDLTFKEGNLDLLCNLAVTLKIGLLEEKVKQFLTNRLRNDFDKFVDTFLLSLKFQSLNIAGMLCSIFRSCEIGDSIIGQIRELSPYVFNLFLNNFGKYILPVKVILLIFSWISHDIDNRQKFLQAFVVSHVKIHVLTDDMYYELRNYKIRYCVPENLMMIIWQVFNKKQMDMGSLSLEELSYIHRLTISESPIVQTTIDDTSDVLLYSPITMHIQGSPGIAGDGHTSQEDNFSVPHQNVGYQKGSDERIPSSRKRKGNPRKLKKSDRRNRECSSDELSRNNSSDIDMIAKDFKTEMDDSKVSEELVTKKDQACQSLEMVEKSSIKDSNLKMSIISDDNTVDADFITVSDDTDHISPFLKDDNSESDQEMHSETSNAMTMSFDGDAKVPMPQDHKPGRTRSVVKKGKKKNIKKTQVVKTKKTSRKSADKKKLPVSSMKNEKEETETLSLRCEICDCISTSTNGYYKHLKEHYEGPPFKCSECEVTRNSIRDLIVHQYKHSSERRFTCEECGQKFKYPSGLTGHMKLHTGEIKEKNFTCEICDKKFYTDKLLDAHKLIHGTERPFLCHLCGFSTKSQSDLSTHQRIHTGRVFKCEYQDCSYSTPRKGAFQRHQKSHLQKRDYQCPTCGKIFIHEQTLARHESIHSGYKPFKCSECWYATHRKDKFKEHMRKRHGDNPTAKRKLPVPRKMRQELEAQGWIERKDKNKMNMKTESDFSMLISHVASKFDRQENSFIPGMESYENLI